MKKTAIITGGSRGIGLGISKQLGLDGYNIVIVSRASFETYTDTLKYFDINNIDYLYISADISDISKHQEIVDKTIEKFKTIDILINNAGVAPNQRADLLEMSEESFDRVFAINTKSNMFLTQCVAKQMIKQPLNGKKRGTIVNVSSCSATVSSTNRGEYCVSKAGIAMLTKLYADRLASENILVHEVRPGVIETDMTSGVKEKYDNLFSNGTFPIARWGTVEDVSGVVSALCSDKFLYTTGNFIDVDGGFHIQRL